MFCLLSYHKLIKNFSLWLKDNFTGKDEENSFFPQISKSLRKTEQFSKTALSETGKCGRWARLKFQRSVWGTWSSRWHRTVVWKMMGSLPLLMVFNKTSKRQVLSGIWCDGLWKTKNREISVSWPIWSRSKKATQIQEQRLRGYKDIRYECKMDRGALRLDRVCNW